VIVMTGLLGGALLVCILVDSSAVGTLGDATVGAAAVGTLGGSGFGVGIFEGIVSVVMPGVRSVGGISHPVSLRLILCRWRHHGKGQGWWVL
jgi:hypothetical protein